MKRHKCKIKNEISAIKKSNKNIFNWNHVYMNIKLRPKTEAKIENTEGININ